jgi:hypothetical protein
MTHMMDIATKALLSVYMQLTFEGTHFNFRHDSLILNLHVNKYYKRVIKSNLYNVSTVSLHSFLSMLVPSITWYSVVYIVLTINS